MPRGHVVGTRPLPKSGRGVYRKGLPEVVWLACKCLAHLGHGTHVGHVIENMLPGDCLA